MACYRSCVEVIFKFCDVNIVEVAVGITATGIVIALSVCGEFASLLTLCTRLTCLIGVLEYDMFELLSECRLEKRVHDPSQKIDVGAHMLTDHAEPVVPQAFLETLRDPMLPDHFVRPVCRRHKLREVLREFLQEGRGHQCETEFRVHVL